MYEVCMVNGKTTLRWQKIKVLFSDLTNLDLNCNEFFLINSSAHANSFLLAKAHTFLSMKMLFKSL